MTPFRLAHVVRKGDPLWPPASPPPPRVCIRTLGCKVNQCDSDEMARSLLARGFDVVEDGAADLYLINTCTVTATADAKARKLARKLAREHPGSALVLTGCWAQRDPVAAAALPQVAAVVPNDQKSEIGEIASRLLGRSVAPATPRRPFGRSVGFARLGRTRAFVKIQDGCDHHCAYCAVPQARGRPASRPLPQVLDHLWRLADAGIQEVVLCGIRLGAYAPEQPDRPALADLLGGVRDLPIPRLRLSSIEPMDADERLLSQLADHPTVCHHLHLPLQSGDDAVLAAMGRGYTAGEYAQTVARVRAIWADAAITSDVMVGFPGESDEQFERTVRFVREIGFSRLHVFAYSPRPGTAAAQRDDQIPASVRRQRAACLLAVAADLAQRAALSWVGREVRLLAEKETKVGELTGLTEQYLRARCPGPRDWIGRIVAAKVRRVAAGELMAHAQTNA